MQKYRGARRASPLLGGLADEGRRGGKIPLDPGVDTICTAAT
jgi:hypothetical protein